MQQFSRQLIIINISMAYEYAPSDIVKEIDALAKNQRLSVSYFDTVKMSGCD